MISMKKSILAISDFTYCINAYCDNQQCERHLDNLKGMKGMKGIYINVADLSGICRYHIGKVIDILEEQNET